MAWIIGDMTAEEKEALASAGWNTKDTVPEFQSPELEPEELPTQEIYVDNDMFDIMTGADWEHVEDTKVEKWYTVLLARPKFISEDATDTYLAHVRATGVDEAVGKARDKVVKTGGWDNMHRYGYRVLLVAQGKITDLYAGYKD